RLDCESYHEASLAAYRPGAADRPPARRPTQELDVMHCPRILRHSPDRLINAVKPILAAVVLFLFAAAGASASEADLAIPDLRAGHFNIFGSSISAWNLLFGGAVIIFITCGFSVYLRTQIRRLPAHKSMLNVADVIYKTCKTYLIQQGKFLVMLFIIMGTAMTYYFMGLQHETARTVALVLFFTVVGMAGSYSVAWYGIRVNTYANCRTAFAALRGEPWDVVNIPLRAGMSVGLFLISLELVMM